eukprot:4640755-Prymnesium_polylepis.1
MMLKPTAVKRKSSGDPWSPGASLLTLKVGRNSQLFFALMRATSSPNGVVSTKVAYCQRRDLRVPSSEATTPMSSESPTTPTVTRRRAAWGVRCPRRLAAYARGGVKRKREEAAATA